ncbi:MAG: enoyl-CoA hydratase/isomerase family protein [Gammaproteobacteria bacterium]|nr:enoyl-CoA hydratase/isomerase family protein [Gammaproteobacteria bacterium]|tara:strand:- start:406 stop:1191 length:786 start_codon:yes stop_codon:yes gene_type:complete
MSETTAQGLSVTMTDYVAIVEIRRPPNNFFDFNLIRQIADTYELLDNDDACRAIVLCSEGKHFCAGADFSARESWGQEQLDAQAGNLYREAARVFRAQKPVIAAVQGAAIGGGLGLACSADHRVTCREARFSANFSRLAFHQGFGLSETLPRLIGPTQASLLLLTGRRVPGDDAHAMGLADELVPQADVRERAMALAQEIAASAPLAVRAIRATLRDGLADAVIAATEHELNQQSQLRLTEDFQEGVRAMAERRAPHFEGR